MGYNTVTCESGKWYIIAGQFTDVAGAEAVNINDYLKLASDSEINACDADESTGTWDTAPQIQVLQEDNGKFYDQYFYCKNAYLPDGETQVAGWVNKNDWGDISTRTLEPWRGFWFTHTSTDPIRVTTAGQVAEATMSFDCVANKWKLATIPYPSAIALNSDKMTWSNMECCDADESTGTWDTATQIQILQEANGKFYDQYFYCKNAYLPDGETQVAGWVNKADWGDISTAELLPGRGFWITGPTAARCEFNP